jgi:hypothetical protein
MINAPRIALYSETLNISGKVNTTGLGCQSNSGFGKGKKATSQCSASGGSHGGYGGRA